MIFVCSVPGAMSGLVGGLWMIAVLYLIRRRLMYGPRRFPRWEWGALAGIPVLVGGIAWWRRLVVPVASPGCTEAYLGVGVASLLGLSGYFLIQFIAWCARNSRV